MTTPEPNLMKALNTILSQGQREAFEECVRVLKELVKCNEEWNADVEKIIGRPVGWNYSYLNEARTALKNAEPFVRPKTT